MKNVFRSVFHRIPKSQTALLGGASILLGITTGMGVWLFKWTITFVHGLLFGKLGGLLSPWGTWTVLFIPMVGGAVVGLGAYFFIKEEKLHGTAGVMQAVALTGGRVRYQNAPAKALAAAVSLGAGASVGPEDPSVQIGASLGSMFGQWFHLTEEQVRTLVAAGAGAAIAATFNAPITGVFFALEIVLGEIAGGSLGIVLVASVVSSVFIQAVSGSQPAFTIPTYMLHSAWELPLYLVLGLLAGPFSALYVRLVYGIQDAARRIRLPHIVLTMLTGLLIGATALFFPQVLGVGYDTIGNILNSSTSFPFLLLLGLFVAKLLLTPISLAGRFYGGVFAPALFLGATLGGAFGIGAATLFPGLGIHPAAFALVGMAAVLAGSVHAPLTAILLLFEMTNDYRIILPLMFSVAVSLLISQRIQKDSVYAFGLARDGIRLDRGRDVEVLQTVTVQEIMDHNPDVMQLSTSLEEAHHTLDRTRHHGMPVVDSAGRLVGILTMQDLERGLSSGFKTAGDACVRDLEVAYPDEPVSLALERMSRKDLGRLPVVSHLDPTKLEGILTRADVIHAYDIALSRRTQQRHRDAEARLDALTPARVIVTDMVVEPGSQCVGKKMSEIPFPQDIVIASVRRRGQVFIPRGKTILQDGDTLVVVAEAAGRDEVALLCRQQPEMK